MIIPNFVHDKVVDGEGNLTPQWIMFFTQLLDQMQLNLSEEGIVAPSQTTSNITIIESDPNNVPLNGTLLYDSTTNQLKVRLSDGTFHVIQTV